MSEVIIESTSYKIMVVEIVLDSRSINSHSSPFFDRVFHHKMPHSHHSHSGQFCRHAAQGTTLEDVVLEAIRKGFKTFGLSEHCPRYQQEDLYPEEVSADILVQIFCLPSSYVMFRWRVDGYDSQT